MKRSTGILTLRGRECWSQRLFFNSEGDSSSGLVQRSKSAHEIEDVWIVWVIEHEDTGYSRRRLIMKKVKRDFE
jgi:hypothetical protein